MARRLAIIVFFSVVSTACGLSQTTESTELVALAARVQCDRERYAFDSLEDLGAVLDGHLAAAELTLEEYESFEEALERDADLRARVLEEYEQYCLR